MLKTFYYQFDDPHFIRSIQVNTKECPTIKDLTSKIAAFFNLSFYHLIVENQPNEKQLEKITEKFIFAIRFPNRRTDITFFLPKSKTINLQNGYKLSYNQIIFSFQKNNYYFSDECAKNHLQFMIFDKELPHIEFPLIAIPSGICINVKLRCEQVIITYGENYFIFAEDEMASEAFKIIKYAYNGCHSVSIQTNESKINERNSLRRFVTYMVGVYFKITFKNIETWNEELLILDFHSTVSDAQNQLFTRIGNSDVSNSSKIIIYNGNMQIINDNHLMLKNIQDFSNFFYFKIKKKSPEKITPKKTNIELDSRFSYTPNRKTKASYIDYSNTPELRTKSDYNYNMPFYAKTPEKLPNSFYNLTFSDVSERNFDSESNKKKTNKIQRKSNSNSNKKSSAKLKPTSNNVSNASNTNSSMHLRNDSNSTIETQSNNKKAISSISPNKINSNLNKKNSNKSLNDSNSNSIKISKNEPNFNPNQKYLTNSKSPNSQFGSSLNKKILANSKEKSYQQSSAKESTNPKSQESKLKDEFDEEYDEYFEKNSSSRNDKIKDNSNDFQQSLELDELKKLLNEEEEEEFYEKNENRNSNKQNEMVDTEEEEFEDRNDSGTIEQKDNSTNNEEEEDIINQETENQNKIDDLSDGNAFFVDANDDDSSNSNQTENIPTDIFEEEEEDESTNNI